jgi:dipeptidase E
MVSRLFLASKHVGGLSRVLPGSLGELRTVFVPTAGSVFGDAPWLDRRRRWLTDAGFQFKELELSTADVGEVREVLQGADLVYVEGGNTYFLVRHMQRTGFWDALTGSNAVYAGASAGAIAACVDIAYIGELDDPGLAPDLVSTAGGGLVPFKVLPHMDEERTNPTLKEIVDAWPSDDPVICLNDDQAVIVDGGVIRVVWSPPELVQPKM